MKNAFTAAAAGFLCAMAAVLALTPGSWTQYRFETGRYDYEQEKAQVASSLKLFSATLAGFYMTGGKVGEGLNIIPAASLIKRRIFMDINMYTNSNVIFVPDRDRAEVRGVTFLSPVHAVAVTDEDWVNVYQDLQTRRPRSGKKFNSITVRYYLKKLGGKWVILDYEVHTRGEALPPVPADKVVQW
jgi:hypothetical protein